MCFETRCRGVVRVRARHAETEQIELFPASLSLELPHLERSGGRFPQNPESGRQHALSLGQQGPEAPPRCETGCSPGSWHTAPPPKLRSQPHPASVVNCPQPPRLASCQGALIPDSPGQAVTGPQALSFAPPPFRSPDVGRPPGCGLGEPGREGRVSGCLSAGRQPRDSAGPPLECHFPRCVGGVRSQLLIRGPRPSCGAGALPLACASWPHQESQPWVGATPGQWRCLLALR